ncbi:MAG: hypothetical protein AABZ17_11985 [Nitrospirota bacterium]
MMKRSGVFLFFIVALCVWAGNAHAVVLETNEWTTLVRPGWAYNAPPVIDTATNTPAGGGALKMTYQPGTYSTSTGGGRAEFNGLSGTELYVGHWFKFSPGFTFNPFSTKVDYMWVDTNQIATATRAAFTIREQQQGVLWATDVSIQGNGPLIGIPHTVYTTVKPQPLQTGVWYWLEYHVRMNDVIGTSGSFADVVPNGVLEIWLNDVLQGSWNNLRWRDGANRTWKTLLHSPEWGGGGGTIPAIQYMWYDHTVISTTRIGRPASTPSGDTTAPRSPVLNFAN